MSLVAVTFVVFRADLTPSTSSAVMLHHGNGDSLRCRDVVYDALASCRDAFVHDGLTGVLVAFADHCGHPDARPSRHRFLAPVRR